MSIFRRAAERRGTPADLLVVGLGNPGARYEGSRHNVGADVVALVARRRHDELRPERGTAALVAGVDVDGSRVVLAFPTTYVNESGQALSGLVKRHGIDEPERIVVVHDELDLPPGRVQLKRGGGLAGHNGLRSAAAHLGTRDFLRVRIGVGKPPSKEEGAGHVLRRPAPAVREQLAVAVEEAADAVEAIATDGFEAAMNHYNRRPRS